MAEKFLVCENCYQVVARFDPAAVKFPITSNMFHVKHKGERPFWMPNVEAQFMRCPMCPKRVFNNPHPIRLYCSDRIDGMDRYHLDIKYKAVEQIPESKQLTACPICGRLKSEFKSPQGFGAHVKFCIDKAAPDFESLDATE